MSKKNAKKFLLELAKDEAMQNELNGLKPSSPEDVVSFAKKTKFRFTKEELKEVLVETGALKLAEEELADVSGGAYPTAVNSQITDSVTQVNVKVAGDAPAIAMGNLYMATGQALAAAAHNATTAQQQSNVTMQASTTMGVALLYSVDTGSAGIDILKR